MPPARREFQQEIILLISAMNADRPRAQAFEYKPPVPAVGKRAKPRRAAVCGRLASRIDYKNGFA
jgi:hypothetical protein